MIPILISHILRTNLRGLDNLFMDKGKIYTFLNPVSYLMALDRKDLFGQFDGIFADGSILVAAIRLLYGITVKRRSFDMTSMAPELFRFAENNGKMLYIVAVLFPALQCKNDVALDIHNWVRLKFYTQIYTQLLR